MSSQPVPGRTFWGISPALILALLMVLTALFFAAGGEESGLGLLFLLGGVSLALYPPAKTVPKPWRILSVLFVGLALYTFIPGLSWFSGDWRKEMAGTYGLTPSTFLTAQPWLTFDSTVLFLFAGILFYYWSLQAPEAQVRRQVLRFLAVVMLLFSCAVAVVFFGNFSFPGWKSPTNLGPFENRNQLSSILALSLVLLLGLFSNDIKKHRLWATVWALGSALDFYLLVLNYSRAGIVLFLVGAGAWLVINLQKGRKMDKLAFVFAAVALLFSAFFIWGGKTLSRFDESAGNLEFAGSHRMSIQQDALSMVEGQPLTGVGLGNFASVFPQYRNVFQSEFFVRHPESDWLWLMAETGLAGVLVIGGLGVLWLLQVLPLKSGTDKHFRSLCLVLVGLLLLHGVVDVSLHRTGVLIFVLLAAPLAMTPFPDRPSGPGARFGWRFVGGLLLLWGLGTVTEAAGWWSKPGEYRVRRAIAHAETWWTQNRMEEGLAAMDLALKSAPMNWELYYWKASYLLKSGDISGARDNFRRARFFEKNSANLAMNESLQWMPVRPDLALAAANETLQRSRYAPGSPYEQLVREAKRLGNEDVARQLSLMAKSYPALKHYYLETAPEEEFDLWLNDDEQSFRDRGSYWFWDLLRTRKNSEYLLNWLEGRPDRQNFFYRQGSSMLAEKGNWQEAFLMIKNHMPPAILPEPVLTESAKNDARQKSLLDPSDVGPAFQVIQMDLADGHYSVALEKILPFLGKEKTPAYFYYLAARAQEGMEDWQKAFWALSKFEELRSKK